MARMPVQKPGRSEQSVGTPPEFLIAVKKALDISVFVYDFAADRHNTVSPFGFYDEEIDALTQPHWEHWTDVGWGWLNPPYARIAPWVAKCQAAGEAGGHIALLVPASVGSNWFRDYIEGQAHVLLLNGRLTFVGHTSPYPKDLMLCLYGHPHPDIITWNWKVDKCPL